MTAPRGGGAAGRSKVRAPKRRNAPAVHPPRAHRSRRPVVRPERTHRSQRLRVVRAAGGLRPRRLPFLIASFLVVGSLVVAVVSMQALVAQSAFRIQQLTRRTGELSDDAGRLQLQIAQLSAPRRIAREARRLGYRLPDQGEIHTIAVGGAP